MTKSVCALGFFDGVHDAHTSILSECARYAKENGYKSIALTFEKSPAEYFGKKIQYLTSLEHKKELMLSLGIDEVVILPCDEKTLSLTPEEFVCDILVKSLNAQALFCGFNYTFGKGAKGNTDVLKNLGKDYGFDVFISPCMTENGITVSSSEIRTALAKGNITFANSMLTRPFEVRGIVEEGKKLGRTIGFPTVNIYPDNLPDLPYGVYATKTVVDDKEYISITNVGFNPTVGDKNLRIETYIHQFDEDIYNKNIRVKFYTFLRPEQKFDSVEDLKTQIEKDTQSVIKFFKELH